MTDDNKENKNSQFSNMFEKFLPIEKTFNTTNTKRNELINELKDQSEQLQIKTIIEIEKYDQRLSNMVNTQIERVGLTNISKRMKTWKPFKGDTKYISYIHLINKYYEKLLNTSNSKKTTNLLRWEGVVWTVIYNGKKVRIKDTIGMHIIAHLIKFMGQSIRADKIYESIASSENLVNENYSTMSKDQLKEQENIALEYESTEKLTYVDEQTIREARERIEDIDIELQDAAIQEDIDKVNLLVSEKTNIESYLNMTTDKSGNPREISDRIEKSRKAAIQAVKIAKKNIEKEHIKLFLHFDQFLTIRKYSHYLPKPDHSWEIKKNR